MIETTPENTTALIIQNLRDENERLALHLQRLGDAILEQANDRAWCEEYNIFAEQWGLPLRFKEYEITVTVRINACDEETALDIVERCVDLSEHSESVVSSPEYNACEA